MNGCTRNFKEKFLPSKLEPSIFDDNERMRLGIGCPSAKWHGVHVIVHPVIRWHRQAYNSPEHRSDGVRWETKDQKK